MTDYVSPHWRRAALVVIDIQQDFLDGGAAPIEGTSDVLNPIRRLLDSFRAAALPVAHVIRLYEVSAVDVDIVRRNSVEVRPGLVAPGSPGSQLSRRLFDAPVELDAELLLRGEPQSIGTEEVVMFKPRWSAFYRTALDAWLRDRNVDTVVVAGCNLPNCPRATLFDASSRDYRTVLATDAVSQSSPERLADLQSIGVNLMSTAGIRTALNSANVRPPT